MRRPIIALLGATATTVALISGKYVLADSAPGETATADIPALGQVPQSDEPSASASPSTSDASPSPSTSALASGSAGPGVTGTPKPGAPATGTRPAGGGGGGGAAGGGGTPAKPKSCKTVVGNNAWVGEIGGYGMVFVTIKVCDGALTDATGDIIESNYDLNKTAIAAMDNLAVKYYKTDMSKIAYSGATATAGAYRTSLTSAMNEAGI